MLNVNQKYFILNIITTFMQKKIEIWLSQKDHDELHEMMDTVIKTSDDKYTLERLFNGTTKQDWYRKVLRKGLATLILEFEQLKKKYEDENKNCN